MKNIALLLYWYPFRMLVFRLPYPIIYLIGLWVGSILHYASRGKRQLIAAEFSKVFPDYSAKEINKLTRKSFIVFCLSEIQILLYPRLNPETISETIAIEGLHHLDEALKKGKGVLLLQAHLGAFQMVMPAIGYSGYTMNQISASALVWEDRLTSKIQKKGYEIKSRYESTLPIKHVAVHSSMRPVYRALANNEIVGISSDGGGGKRIVDVAFLGRTAYFQEGVAVLAAKTGAEIIPAFILTDKWLRHRLILHKPLMVSSEKNGEEGTGSKIIQNYAFLLEKYVNNYPDHYGYTLYLRRSRVGVDSYPFFLDHTDHLDFDIKNI